MIKKLVDLLVKSVDLVDVPANQSPFIVIKEEGNKQLPEDKITEVTEKEDSKTMATDNLNIDKDKTSEELVEKQMTEETKVEETKTEEKVEKAEEKEPENVEVSEEAETEKVEKSDDGSILNKSDIENIVNNAVQKAISEALPKQDLESTEDKKEETTVYVAEKTEEGKTEVTEVTEEKNQEEKVTDAINALGQAVDDLKSMVTKVETPVTETVEKSEEKPEEKEEVKEEESKDSEIILNLTKAVEGLAKNCEEINKRLNNIEGTVNVSKSAGDGDTEGDEANNSTNSFWTGVLDLEK